MASSITNEIKEAFLTASEGKDTISSTQFCVLVKNLGSDMTANQLDASFKALDKDGSNSISLDEFSAWWTNNNSGGLLGNLRSKLMSSKGGAYLTKLFTDKVEHGDCEPAKVTLYGAVKEAQMGVLFSVDEKHEASDSAIDAIKNADGGYTLSLKLKSANSQSAALLCALFRSLWNMALLAKDQLRSFKFNAEDQKDGDIVVSLTYAKDQNENNFAAFLGNNSFSYPIENAVGFKFAVEFGWSFAQLAKDFKTFKFTDLLNIAVVCALSKIPIPKEQYAEMIGMAKGFSSQMGLPIEIDFDCVSDLENGNLAAQIDLTKNVQNAIDFAKNMAPVPFTEISVMECAESFGAGMVLGSMSDSQFEEAKSKFQAVKGAWEVAKAIILRDCQGLSGLSATVFNGGSGKIVTGHLEFHNIVDFRGIFALIDAVAGFVEEVFAKNARS